MINLQDQRLIQRMPVLIASFLNLLLICILEWQNFHSTGGTIAYPLDDPYIHLDIARNLADHGSWGINPGSFDSASSSVLFSLLLAGCIKLFGSNALWPLIINILAGSLLLVVTDNWLRREAFKPLHRLGILVSLIIFTPLPILTIAGMEHVLQILLLILFFFQFCSWVSDDSNDRREFSPPWTLLVLAFLNGIIRYESLFFLFFGCCYLLFRKRLVSAIFVGTAALAGPLIFGLISVRAGGFFLPNSLIVKSVSGYGSGGVLKLIEDILVNRFSIVDRDMRVPSVPPAGISLLATQRLLVLLPLLFGVLYYRKEKKSYRVFVALLLCTTMLHLALASTGWFYRYEAYLIYPSILMTGVVMIKLGPELKRKDKNLSWATFIGTAAILCFAIFFPWFLRGAAAWTKAERAMQNIYGQQIQMSRFVRTYYANSTVAVNDIGAVGYYGNAKVVDLWGLGNLDIATAKKEHRYTPAFLRNYVENENVQLIMIYEDWFDHGVYDGWAKAGEWIIRDNVILGGDRVSFFAQTTQQAEKLKSNLEKFRNHLPPSVSLKLQP